MDFSFLRLWVDFDRLCWADFGGLWLWRLVVVGLILGFSYNCWLIMGSGGFAVAVDCGVGGGWGGSMGGGAGGGTSLEVFSFF